MYPYCVQVLRVSVGLETKTLQKLYAAGGAPAEVPRPYHWFSLHTSSRSFDFGVSAACGAEVSETLVLWVHTLQQLLSAAPGNLALAEAAGAGQHVEEIRRNAFSALSYAQRQWQHHASSAKEWACLQCTVVNPGGAGGAECNTCGAPRPEVTLCPCLMPLLPTMQARPRDKCLPEKGGVCPLPSAVRRTSVDARTKYTRARACMHARAFVRPARVRAPTRSST